jgi:hypothetical protein
MLVSRDNLEGYLPKILRRRIIGLESKRDVNALLIDQRSLEQAKIVNQKHHGEKCVVACAPGKGSDKAEREPQAHGDEICRTLIAKMRNAFEQCINYIDWKNEREEKKNVPMVFVTITAPLSDRLLVIGVGKKQ